MKRIVWTPIICALAACVTTASHRPAPIACAPAPSAVSSDPLSWRTELYFGLSIPGGGQVSEAAWRQFVAAEICPRFPGGFTVLDASGAWRSPGGEMVGEASRVLVILHSGGARNVRELDAIRKAYADRFQQQSVLRVDQPAQVSVDLPK